MEAEKIEAHIKSLQDCADRINESRGLTKAWHLMRMFGMSVSLFARGVWKGVLGPRNGEVDQKPPTVRFSFSRNGKMRHRRSVGDSSIGNQDRKQDARRSERSSLS